MDEMYDLDVRSRLAPTDGSFDALANQVNELKSLFRDEYSKNENIYDKFDYDRIMDQNDDYFARRWIIHQPDVTTAFETMKDTLRWRKKMNLNGLNFEDFPREFFECGCVFDYGRDKKGRRVMYVRCRLFKPIGELSDLYDKYFAFMIDQCEKRCKADGFTIVYDVTDAGLSNVEWSKIKFMISCKDRFAVTSRRILIVALPKILTSVFKIIMSLIPANQASIFKLINLEDLSQFIDEDQIPQALGGSSKVKFQLVPSRARAICEFEELNREAGSKFKKHVENNTDPSEYETVESLPVLR